MDNYLIYLLKVAAGTALFYLLYIALFSRDTFYLRNRIFLITALIVPSFLPLLKIPVYRERTITSVLTNLASDNLNYPATTSASGQVQTTQINYFSILFWIYILVSAFFLIRTLLGIISTYTIIRKGSLQKSVFPKIVISEARHSPFSFFPYAVIPADYYKSSSYEDLLDHEFAHIRQGHTFDLILSELFIVFQWFNPFVWLTKRSIVLNHEYLADNISLKKNKSIKEYQYRLLQFQREPGSISLAHNFSSLIKNRIIMINKKPTRRYATLKNFFILPVVAFGIYAFAVPEHQKTINGPDAVKLQQSSSIQRTDPSTAGFAFSKASEGEILKFLAMNTTYPQEARMKSDTGKLYVVVKMSKGGIIKECKAYTRKDEVKVPVLPEIVIVGYKTAPSQNSADSKNQVSADHLFLKNEGERIAKRLPELTIPEWKDKDMEFALMLNFQLK